MWEAVFSPRGADGYPARIWCKDPRDDTCEYGAIDKRVAAYWKEHFDMTEKLRRGWAHGLGDKLSGKLHVYVGASDTFFLTNAVMDLQARQIARARAHAHVSSRQTCFGRLAPEEWPPKVA